MQDKTSLIEALDRVRGEMRALLSGVDSRGKIYPGWTIKELLAHLAGWDDATVVALQALKANQATPQLASRGIDAYNLQTVAERAGLEYEQIVREWELAREQLKALVNAMEPDDLGREVLTTWGTTLTVAQHIWVMIDHEEEHAAAVRRWQSGARQD